MEIEDWRLETGVWRNELRDRSWKLKERLPLERKVAERSEVG